MPTSNTSKTSSRKTRNLPGKPSNTGTWGSAANMMDIRYEQHQPALIDVTTDPFGRPVADTAASSNRPMNTRWSLHQGRYDWDSRSFWPERVLTREGRGLSHLDAADIIKRAWKASRKRRGRQARVGSKRQTRKRPRHSKRTSRKNRA